MNVPKSTVKTWTDAPQVSSLKGPTSKSAGAGEFEQAFGDQSLGDVLNKIADPSWVDKSKMRQVGNPTLDKDAFMKLMLHQMQNQDPTNPLKSHEMAAQLAQFSSLEQMTNINETLKDMSSQQSKAQQFDVMQFIGKSVAGDSSSFTRIRGEKLHELSFKLPQDAKFTKINIKNAEGKVVKELQIPGLKAGDNSVAWNGVTSEGLEARSGEYRFEIESTGVDGRKLAVDTRFEGPVTGVKFVNGQPVLLVGNKTVKVHEVQSIQAPKMISMLPMANDVTPVDQLTQATGLEQEPTELQSNLGELNLSPQLLEKISKEMNEGGTR